MPAIYAADCWCDDCAEAIKKRLRGEGKTPENPDDETTYDSDEWPKYMSEDEAADSPQHCASGDECLNAIELADSNSISTFKIGALLSTELTNDGVEYVRELTESDPDSDVVKFWKEAFEAAGYDFS